MAKQANQYFGMEPWRIIEEGFCPAYSQVSESVFALGNEYMGVRGYFEEGYSGESMVGSYFNGVYSSAKIHETGYKGIVTVGEFMVNSVNWLAAEISMDGEVLDLHTSGIRDYVRILDMKNGLLTRKFVWITESGKETEFVFERFLSMSRMHVGAQRITMTALNYDGDIEVKLFSDFGTIHMSRNQNFWEVIYKNIEEAFFEIGAKVENYEKEIYSSSFIAVKNAVRTEKTEQEKQIGRKYTIAVRKGEKATATRLVYNDSKAITEEARNFMKEASFEGLLQETASWWKQTWEQSDIVIDGDEENQQGIRYCIFQMMQTYHGAQPGNNIGAKGLSGEGYGGCAFWDTETYCLPFFIFNNMTAARNLLMFRYKTLGEARKRAKELDCRGAFYPISTVSGRETCHLWQHASLQLQASTAVAYGIWFYEKISGDTAFLEEYGMEMLIEISRMLASRGDWSADKTQYGYYCVMGPDEFQMMVNHNCYTNYMGQFTLRYTAEVWKRLQEGSPEKCAQLQEKLAFTEEEIEDWLNKACHMVILQDKESLIYEQQEGFFKLPHVDVNQIPVEEFPLYHHWTYDRIYRNDMIKQPDVLMLFLLFNTSFTEEELKANYEYYEPKCIHESSLSPSVHSILAAQLKKKEDALKFFQFATRMDLDNYNRNTCEGLHTTSIAAAWMNIVYGFGGMRSDGDMLEFTPTIPQKWEGYSFHITYKDAVIEIRVEKENVFMKLLQDKAVTVKVYGREYNLTKEICKIPIAEEWR